MFDFDLKTPRQVDGLVYVTNSKGELVEVHSTMQLGVEFFKMSNDDFYNKYGFNFVPKGIWWEKSREKAGLM